MAVRVVCAFCGREFDTARSTRKTCSHACRDKAYRAAHRHVCIKCGVRRDRDAALKLCRVCWREHARAEAAARVAQRSMFDRFWDRVPIAGEDECWEWLGAILGNGYGQFSSFSGSHAHRVMWEIVNRLPVPPGLMVLHSCDNPPCVNPRHLRVGTASDNMRDMYERGRHPNARKRSLASVSSGADTTETDDE